ncbi:hypothetical protein EB796_024636 [Bugula neritina]|uniref:Uncharacterized protein n=1 Tax=Bugula neritina TaxID=10212 RepID=A0A7J7IU24_BUGNE|nr:hypothetical protein EB796_024636 [Bugula neritina]
MRFLDKKVTPDGVTEDNEPVEVKCPFPNETENGLLDMIERDKNFYLTVNKEHPDYDEIQMQIEATEKDKGYLVVYYNDNKDTYLFHGKNVKPDGLTKDNEPVKVTCPRPKETESGLLDMIEQRKDCFVIVNNKHDAYDQIQKQMHVMCKEKGYLVVYYNNGNGTEEDIVPHTKQQVTQAQSLSPNSLNEWCLQSLLQVNSTILIGFLRLDFYVSL